LLRRGAPLFPFLRRAALLSCAVWAVAGCSREDIPAPGVTELSVLMAPDTHGVWRRLFEEFSRRHPEIRIRHVEGPTATNTREDLYVTSFLSGKSAYDLIYADVPWIPKFAAAGWLEDLTDQWEASEWDRFLPGAVEGSKYKGRIYRMPVQMNGGLLFYRSDLLREAGFHPPTTFEELVHISRELQSPPERWGYVWQGKQYEGLTCDFLEVLTGFGGTWIDPETGRVGLDAPEAIAALAFLSNCIHKDRISPPGTLTYEEEPSRELFQSGRAIFHRNWPYAWALSQSDASPIRGRVGIVPMPRASNGRHASTLGGWGFAVASNCKDKDAAWKFLEFMATVEPIRELYASDGVEPALREFYEESSDPALKQIYEVLKTAIPRPMIPQYAQASDILQRHVSAALSLRTAPEEALAAAARETRLLLSSPE
jgi:multiple sugar transport system substrate-binding protein